MSHMAQPRLAPLHWWRKGVPGHREFWRCDGVSDHWEEALRLSQVEEASQQVEEARKPSQGVGHQGSCRCHPCGQVPAPTSRHPPPQLHNRPPPLRRQGQAQPRGPRSHVHCLARVPHASHQNLPDGRREQPQGCHVGQPLPAPGALAEPPLWLSQRQQTPKVAPAGVHHRSQCLGPLVG